MATKKTTTTKKTTASKKPAAKATKATKPAVKRAPKAKTKVQAKSTRTLGLQSEKEDFMTFRVNRETVYWLVLGGVVILFTIWLMQLQSDIQKLYDEIDANTASAYVIDSTIAAKKTNQ